MYLQGVITPATYSVREAVADALRDLPLAVLAVSGGLDSIVLLDAAAAVRPPESLLVATFNHGTGAHATRAATHVARRAGALGIQTVVGRRPPGRATESAWRDDRLRFFSDVVSQTGGTVVTAHTRDDQVETVLMRTLRGSGARGLAGLYARSNVRKPLLQMRRATIARYAAEERLTWVEDPTNLSLQFLRNRVRHEILPALRRASPDIDTVLLDIARRASQWRNESETLVSRFVPHAPAPDGGLDVAVAPLAGYSREALAVVWAVLAAGVGLTLDRRGTQRLVEFTNSGRTGARIQLSGGWEVVRGRERFELRRVGAHGVLEAATLGGAVRWGRWRFEPVSEAEADAVEGASAADLWAARLPGDRPLYVRCWHAGDAMTGSTGLPRKVKRLLLQAGITGSDRPDWPVVVAEDEIVWIPGVRRRDAATDRSGRPVRAYRCELNDR